MSANKTVQKQEIEVDLQLLISAVFRKLWLVAIVAVIFSMVAFMYTYCFVSPKYQSYTGFYVNNSSISVGNTISIDSGDISASKSLVDSYIVILMTRQTLNDVIDYAGVNRSYGAVRGMISASSVNETEIFRVTVTSTDPVEAYQLASAIEHILPSRIGTIVEGSSAKVVDQAVLNTAPVSPNYSINASIGFMVGAALVIALIILRTVLNVTVRSEEDITRSCGHPILTAVPNMASLSKGGYYGYGEEKKSISDRVASLVKRPELFGSGISFAASEAYKLLRTKIMFSFADEQRCRVIGVSSALAGEGKSLTAVNLAYSLSQMDKKVLLIDCDMRRPSLSTKLPIKKIPGLSNYLSAQSQLDELIQPCGMPNEEQAFYVIAAGVNPPNPVELLSSPRMGQMLNLLRERYDYVIMDLPPVGEVSDALAVTKQADGMLLVVRQNYCDKNVLSSVVRQFNYMGSKVLGVIYNCASEGNGLYKKSYYYKYQNKYESSYERAKKKKARGKYDRG